MSDPPKRAFIHIAPGAVVNEGRVSNNLSSGTDVFVDNCGLIDSLELDGNTHIAGQPLEHKEPDQEASDSGKHWYKRPIGLIGLAIVGSVLSAMAILAIRRYFPEIGL